MSSRWSWLLIAALGAAFGCCGCTAALVENIVERRYRSLASIEVASTTDGVEVLVCGEARMLGDEKPKRLAAVVDPNHAEPAVFQVRPDIPYAFPVAYGRGLAVRSCQDELEARDPLRVLEMTQEEAMTECVEYLDDEEYVVIVTDGNPAVLLGVRGEGERNCRGRIYGVWIVWRPPWRWALLLGLPFTLAVDLAYAALAAFAGAGI